MNILIYGAGVIGSVYGARLHAAGHTITVLARGERLEQIRSQGLVTEDVGTGQRTVARVATIAHLAPEDAYDAIFVTVRADQVAEVLPALAANRATPVVVTFINLASGVHRLAESVGPRRLVLGFPGLGGGWQGTVIRYAVLSQQPTMLGIAGGGDPSKVRSLVNAVQGSGLRVAVSSQMEAWFTCHAVFIAAMESALLRHDGDALHLAASREAVAQMVLAVREGFRALLAPCAALAGGYSGAGAACHSGENRGAGAGGRGAHFTGTQPGSDTYTGRAAGEHMIDFRTANSRAATCHQRSVDLSLPMERPRRFVCSTSLARC